MRRLERVVVALLLLMIAIPAVTGILLILQAGGHVLWSQEATGWVQAVGSVAAIWYSLKSVREADRLSAERRYDSMLALAVSAQKYSSKIGDIFSQHSFGYLDLRIAYQNGAILDDLIDALKAIPAHEIGSYNAVLALASLRKAMFDFKGNLNRAQEQIERETNPETNNVPSRITWDSAALHLCVREIRRATEGMKIHNPKFTN